MNNADPCCLDGRREVLRHGGHLATGWNFFLPNDHQGATAATGQKDWRFCGKCRRIVLGTKRSSRRSLSKGGTHAPIGWNFFLPNDHQVQPIQPDKGIGGFAQSVTDSSGHRTAILPEVAAWRMGPPHNPVGWNFSLPNDHQGATDITGQKQWRFCANCHGLFGMMTPLKAFAPALRAAAFICTRYLERKARQGQICSFECAGTHWAYQQF